jgi:hypothetical protein
VRKISPHRDFFVRSLYFIRSCFFCPDCLGFCLLFLLYNTNIQQPVEFEFTIPASKQPQTYALYCTATGIGSDSIPGPSNPQRVAIPTELSYDIISTSSLPAVKRPRHSINHPPTSSVEVKQVEPQAFMASYSVTFTFTFLFK